MSDAITVTTVVAVDPATAFEVFTGEIDRWWRRGPRFRFLTSDAGILRFEPGPGGRLVEEGGGPGGECFEVGRVLAWEPGRRVAFEFRARAFAPDERTEVEVRFEAEGAGTRVTVEHRGWDAFAADHPVRHGVTGTAFDDMMGIWWADQWTSIRLHVARTRTSATGG